MCERERAESLARESRMSIYGWMRGEQSCVCCALLASGMFPHHMEDIGDAMGHRSDGAVPWAPGPPPPRRAHTARARAP